MHFAPLLVLCLFQWRESESAQPFSVLDPKQNVFEFHFTLEWRMTMAAHEDTMGWATMVTYNVDEAKYEMMPNAFNYSCNATLPLPLEGVPGFVTATGKHKRVIMINGQVPGPAVVVPYGSEVVVKVSNRLASEAVSIHFHGMDKKDQWFMDGVSGMQQCPIAPNNDFTYRFTADTRGTHFYHGHLGTDRIEGLFGPVVVMPEDRSVLLHDGTRKVPDVEYLVTLFDWSKMSGTDLWYSYHWNAVMRYSNENEGECWRRSRMLDGTWTGTYPFSAITINDKGWYNQEDITKRPFKLDLETFAVEEGGKAYLFRMVHAGHMVGLLISVEGHKLEVVSTDGAPVRGTQTDFILMYPGERYDFILTSKEKADKDVYYMIVETLDYYDYYDERMAPFYALAKIQYREPILNQGSVPDLNHAHCASDSDNCTVLNCPSPIFPFWKNLTHKNVDDLEYVGDVEHEILNQSLRQGSEGFEEYFLFFHSTNLVNGYEFRYPKGPPYFYRGNEPAVMYTCPDHNNSTLITRKCTFTLNITLGSVVQFVLMGGGFHHPIHLHSTHFHVVKVGYGKYNSTGAMVNSTDDLVCHNMHGPCTWTNSSWLNGNIPGMNLENPVFKDTVVLPAGGYVVVRFKADNPGWWVMHCHIFLHHMVGMAVGIRIGEHEQMPRPPTNFPQCGVFDPIYGSGENISVGTTSKNIHTAVTALAAAVLLFKMHSYGI